ncbi:protein of unknown function (DUF4286) [Apibacter mensalis]|uniref:DUF4286 domain-containing protein n=1 Tax=Apibacter mensalis TaxID=1586267 RepID=A0A0X3AM39_9FLAO|nr:DUF4286 family protein [Apibacter mensalis]CVK15450.1 protein of unknown function (DUF4286) [Apibacter mensalis]
MIIYSESFHVEYLVEKEWMIWVKNTLIPEIYKVQKFTKVIFSKVISHTDESGCTYSLQYYTNSKKDLEDYYNNHSDKFARLLFDKFGTKILSFKTELELIESFEF